MNANTNCPSCGAPAQGGGFCPNCGKPVPFATPAYQQPQMNAPVKDSGSFGWAVLGFLVPLVGIILYFVWKREKPRTAKRALKGAIISIVISLVCGIASGLMEAAYYL